MLLGPASRRPTRIRSSGRSCARPRSSGLVVPAEKGDGGLTDAERATRDAAPLVTVVTIPSAVFFLPDEAPRQIADLGSHWSGLRAMRAIGDQTGGVGARRRVEASLTFLRDDHRGRTETARSRRESGPWIAGLDLLGR